MKDRNAEQLQNSPQQKLKAILNNIKQKFLARPLWQRIVFLLLIAIAVSGGVILLANNGKNRQSSQSSNKQKQSFECPDYIKYDDKTKEPIGVKGQEEREIIGEEFDWIRANCPGQSGDPREGVVCPYPNPEYGTEKSFAIDPTNPKIMYIGVEIKGIFKSTDGGQNWKEITNGILAYPIFPLSSNKKCHVISSVIAIDPGNPLRLLRSTLEDTGYITQRFTETGGLWESTDGGDSWRQLIHGEVNAGGNAALAIDPKNPSTIYFGSNNWLSESDYGKDNGFYNKKGIVYKTVDDGKNWEELPTGLLPWLGATGIFVDPQDSNHLVIFGAVIPREGEQAADKDFYPMESLDGGKSWNSWQNRLPKKCTAVTDGAVSSNFKHIFVNANGCNNLVSLDGGKSWREVDGGGYIFSYDPHDSSGNHMIGYSNFLTESHDGGLNWQKLEGAPVELDNKIKISNIVWDPKDQNTIYMNGTQGYLWRSQDGGNTWQTILNLDKLPK